ncbi:MAG: M48 family metalloprotease [Kiritimatiellae bacterium]|nr:M48 family metalloprotease [Kiritimatiellia bacterium]
MDPFALQDEARRNTGRLVALAVIAVVAVVAAVAFVFACGTWIIDCFVIEEKIVHFSSFIANPTVIGVSLLVSILIVLIGFLVKVDDLSSAENLMKSVGAERVFRSKLNGNDADSLARLRLFNVCEEMSISSGVSMPSVWVLPRALDVNAFVAGQDPETSAICVTDCALRYLERDELQGLVAHEFSHILNGDMRLNFRLLMLIAGVTAYNRLGKGMLGIVGSRLDSSDSDDRSSGGFRLPRGGRGGGGGGKGGGAIAVIILVYIATAILLWLVGAVGVFFARLIQCAVSRQREYLADASAAQFTRNPDALASALRLSMLVNSGRSAFGAWRNDISHMLFNEGERMFFSTHPPVADRIKRLSPSLTATEEQLMARVDRIRAERKRVYESRVAANAKSAESKAVDGSSAADNLPLAFVSRLRSPGGAGSVLVQMLRGREPDGLGYMPTRAQKRRLVTRCVIAIRDTETTPARKKWVDTITALAQEDGEIDSFEFMLIASARRYLRQPRAVRMVLAPSLAPKASKVIATVASFGSDPEGGYRAAEPKLSLIPTPLPPMPPPYDDAMEFLGSLSELEALPPLAKREFLFGISATVAQDGVVTDEEADYVAAIADAIGAYGWTQVQAGSTSRY